MVNRRNFLKITAAGAAGTFVTLPLAGSGLAKSGEEPVIIRRKLGRTGIEVPIVSMGVMRADNPALVRGAYESGIRHFDTAHGYQGGKNETMLGEVLKEYPRDSFTVATKIPPEGVDWKTGVIGEGATKDAILSRMEISLQRLQMDHVDILYLHGLSSRDVILHPPFIEALAELKKQGKIRFAGVSTHQNEVETIQAMMENDIYDVVLTSYNFMQGHREKMKEAIAQAAAKGLGIVAMKTMAGAFLDKERTKPVNCRAALKWVLQDENVHTAIPGMVSFEQLSENMSVMGNLEMTGEEKAHIEAGMLLSGLFCDQCGKCVADCRKHLPVNEIMRAYMYAYGYRQYDPVFEIMEKHGVSSNCCADCESCTVSCPKHFNVAEKIADISRISDVPREFLV
jgi:uncharacterized protein